MTLELDYGEHETTITEAERVRVHSYDFFGTLVEKVSVADDVEYAQDFYYNWDFRRERSTDALGRLTQMDWNSCCGQLSSITDAQGHTTAMVYDGQNNRTAYTDAADRTTHYEYEDNLLT
ncbi:MAG: hypothetical protein GY842_00660, partial [bacterium]|nr:hypothetical protein [bacterium]